MCQFQSTIAFCGPRAQPHADADADADAGPLPVARPRRTLLL